MAGVARYLSHAQAWRAPPTLRRRVLLGGSAPGPAGEVFAPFYDPGADQPGVVRFQVKGVDDAAGPVLPLNLAHDTVEAWRDALQATRLARLHQGGASTLRLEVSSPFCGPVPLRGRSYGLAFAVAAVGQALGLTHRVVATGDVGPGGAVRRVGAVGAKAVAVAVALPGAQKLLVPEGCAEEARGALEAVGGSAGGAAKVKTVGEALDLAFGGETWRGALRERWRCFVDATPGQAQKVLIEACRPASGWVFDWSLLGALAEALPPGPARDYGVHVATRRAGGHPPHLGDRLADMLGLGARREARQEILAHGIQSLTDDLTLDAAALTVRYRRAAAYLPAQPEDRILQDAQVLGALGRAAAAAGQLEQARVWCAEAVEEWEVQAHPAEMSRALCELARVLGLLGRSADFDAIVLPRAEAFRQQRYGASPLSGAYVCVAVGQGLALLGRGAEAAAWLLSVEGAGAAAELSSDLACRRDRWLIRCASDGESRAAYQRCVGSGAVLETRLAKLQRAVAVSDPVLAAEALAAWHGDPACACWLRRLEAVPIRDRRSGPLGDAKQIVDAYPY